MNCPVCGAVMRREEEGGDWRCAHCDTLYGRADAEGVHGLGRANGERCPLCDESLVRGAVEQQQFLYCARCRGMLIPMGGFLAVIEQLLERLRSVRRHLESEAPGRPEAELRCPLCHETMDRMRGSEPAGMTVRSCPRCAVNWLEHDELLRASESGA